MVYPLVVQAHLLVLEGRLDLLPQVYAKHRRKDVDQEEGADDAAAKVGVVSLTKKERFANRQTGAAALSVMVTMEAPLAEALSIDSVTSMT